MQPTLVFDLNYLAKGFVLLKLAINANQISLVSIKNLKKAFKAEFFPPSIFLQDKKNASENVSDVSTTTNVARKTAIRYGNQNGPSVVENNEHVLD